MKPILFFFQKESLHPSNHEGATGNSFLCSFVLEWCHRWRTSFLYRGKRLALFCCRTRLKIIKYLFSWLVQNPNYQEKFRPPSSFFKFCLLSSNDAYNKTMLYNFSKSTWLEYVNVKRRSSFGGSRKSRVDYPFSGCQENSKMQYGNKTFDAQKMHQLVFNFSLKYHIIFFYFSLSPWLHR